MIWKVFQNVDSTKVENVERTGKQKRTPKGVDKTHPSVDHKI